MISALPLYIGFLWPLWDRENRALHDLIVNTRVVAADGDKVPFVQLVKGPFQKRDTVDRY